MSDLPNPYFSRINFGHRLHLPVSVPILSIEPPSLEDDIASFILPKTVEYRLVDYIEEHNWVRTETREEYYHRLVKELKSSDDLIWVLHDDGYPNLAAVVVEVAPAWVYKLIE